MQRPLLIIVILFSFSAGLSYAQPSYVDWLDGYVSIDGLPRSLGVNLKFQPPKGWSEQQARRPHIVKMYSSKNADKLSILITDNVTFFSRNEFLDLYDEMSNFVLDMIKKDYPNSAPVLLSKKIFTVDKYPFFAYKVSLTMSGYGESLRMTCKYYYTFYEDKVITITGISSSADWNDYLESLFDASVCSLVFTDQYKK